MTGPPDIPAAFLLMDIGSVNTMNNVNRKIEQWHTFSKVSNYIIFGVARHSGTHRIREWGPLLSRFPTELDIDYSSKFDVVRKVFHQATR